MPHEPTPSDSSATPNPTLPEPQKKAEEKTDNRKSTDETELLKLPELLTLWGQQNTLLWGRLQTVTALQVAIIGGWYGLFLGEKSNIFGALCLTLLGTWLAWRLRCLILCDLEWRFKLKERIEAFTALKQAKLLPSSEGPVHGWKIIREIANGFVFIDLLLFLACAYHEIDFFRLFCR